MTGFFLLLGHLIGDYIIQNDYLAKNKVNPLWQHAYPQTPDEMKEAWYRELLGHFACTLHCLLYTAAIALCAFWWMPWWGYVAVFATHWPIDRFRLAKVWMIHVSGQKDFATGPMAPWSFIIVDNIAHLATLGVIYLIACGVPAG